MPPKKKPRVATNYAAGTHSCCFCRPSTSPLSCCQLLRLACNDDGCALPSNTEFATSSDDDDDLLKPTFGPAPAPAPTPAPAPGPAPGLEPAPAPTPEPPTPPAPKQVSSSAGGRGSGRAPRHPPLVGGGSGAAPSPSPGRSRDSAAVAAAVAHFQVSSKQQGSAHSTARAHTAPGLLEQLPRLLHPPLVARKHAAITPRRAAP
jgi:hypothetical protein